MPEKTFREKYPTYEVYHAVVVEALVKAFGEHVKDFYGRRHTYEAFFAEEKSPDQVVDIYREQYGS